MSESLLIVDDEADLLDTLQYNLEKEGFTVRTARTGAEGLEAVRRAHPSLVLLDLMLPDMSGMEVCRRLRTAPDTRHLPIVMVTAKGDEIDRVVGFELGADDYVAKPFSVRELVLRVRAVLRRSRPAPVVAEPGDAVAFGVLRVDPPGHRVWVDSDEVQLTALEFRLLETFLGRKGRVQSREMLLDEVWGSDISVTARTVDTHVKRLRAKLGAAGDYIETLRGVGYRFRDRPLEG
jgi:two-component system phosphate regulon response regulator PhoB